MNVIFLMTDTTRFDMIGCVNPDISTPNLDRLAAEGVRYERAYTCQPVCGPARAAIFTGLFPHACGSWGNSIALGDNVKTIGQRLRDNGVKAGYIGKWHLDGGDYFGLGRCPDGWDAETWYDMRNYLEGLTPEERAASRLSETSFTGIGAEFTFGHRCADRAVRFIEDNAGSDYLLCVSFDEPHGPFLCPEPYASMYKDYEMPDTPALHDNLHDKPLLHRYWGGRQNNGPIEAQGAGQTQVRGAGQTQIKGTGQPQTQGAVQPQAQDTGQTRARDAGQTRVQRARPGLFYGAQSFVDMEIGRVLAAIDKFAPDALVIYTSDHGCARGAHGILGKGPAVYDEVARVPFIVRWPGRSPAGIVVGGLVSHIDICPTVMDCFGLPIPKIMQGKSMLPSILDPSISINDKVFVTFNRYEVDHDGFGGFQPMRAVVTDTHKMAIHLLDPIDELYDTRADPFDMHNLIGVQDAAHAEVRADLHDAIHAFMNDTRDPFRGYQWANRTWRSAYPPSWWCEGYTRQRENEEYEPRQLDYDDGLPMKEAVRFKQR